jgi:hypothetical protein
LVHFYGDDLGRNAMPAYPPVAEVKRKKLFSVYKVKKGVARVKSGDTVKVHYTGKLDDGSIFDTSAGRKPLADKDRIFDIQLVEIL